MTSGIETSHMGLHVRDIDQSLDFYERRLGLDLVSRGQRAGPDIDDLLDLDGARLDVAVLRMPRTHACLELIRYLDGEGTPIDPRQGNPGSCHVAFYTHDLDETWACLAADGSELQSAEVVRIEGGVFDGGKVIYCTDPDGIRVEFLQGPAYLDGSTRDPFAIPLMPRANETSHVGIHVRALARATPFWIDTLGFDVVAQWVADDQGTRDVIGMPTADLNMAMLRLPGTNGYFEVIEYQNVPRVQVDPHHANPATCHIGLFVDDVEGVAADLCAVGGSLVSRRPVTIADGPARGARSVYAADPDGFRVELIESDAYLDGSPRHPVGT